MLSVGWSLTVWLVILIIVFLIARYLRITSGASFILGVIVATVVLGIVRKPTTVNWGTGASTVDTMYWILMMIVPLIILIYAIWKAATSVEAKGVKVQYIPFVDNFGMSV